MSPATVAATTAPTQAQQEFTRLLRELFQLDQSDLDFGIYRIMRLRAQDVEAFITDELPKALQAAREELATRGLDEVRAARDEARQQLFDNFGTDVASAASVAADEKQYAKSPLFQKALAAYRAAQTELGEATLAEELERTIYQDLYRFFARYYDSGDFVTQPRAGEAAYMLPYNGEEVKLYWANHDQYYIKTGENFRHYRFEVGRPTDADDLTRLTVEFELTDAETAAGNNLNKKGRVFLPASDDYFQFDAAVRRLTLRFRFAVPTPEEAERWGTKQSVAKDEKGVNERIIRDVEAQVQATGDAYLIDFWRRNTHRRGEQLVNAFVYHLHRYTLPNHFDYFIHRNLGSFLGRELDYYLKHELLDLQFLGEDWNRPAQLQAMQQQLLRVSVVRGVALRLITFLHELEEYQRHLFEKKKLVVGAEYCISLDLLPATVRPAVLAHLLADTEPAQQQLRAWQTLGMVPDTAAGTTALRDWLTEAQANFEATTAYARLPLDTQYLTQADTEAATTLRDDILGAFDDLDEQTTGVLINSENWQALNALQAKYREQIECVYIDPPYNTGGDGFAYKDAFQHSSWITLIENRLSVSKSLLKESGVLFTSINDHELRNLLSVQDEVFGNSNRVGYFVWKSRSKPTNAGEAKFRPQKVAEYVVGHASQISKVKYREISSGIAKVYPHEDDLGRYRTTTILTSNLGTYRRKTMRFEIAEFKPDETQRWKGGKPFIQDLFDRKRIDFRDDGTPFLKVYEEDDKQAHTPFYTFMDPEATGTAEDGKTLLNSILTSKHGLDTVKPTELIELITQATSSDNALILDFFAGSGTTAHAILNLNRYFDDSKRRFMLVEMGEYFDTVTKPRVLKASYSSDWEDGMAYAPEESLSQLVQVLRLEQYEDTLNNMEFAAARDAEASEFFADSPENRLRYVLARSESNSKPTLGPAVFTHPFAYELCIVLANERRETTVDLVASFNLLLGLHVERLWAERGPDNRRYRLVRGHRRGRGHLCIWRDAPGHGQPTETEEAALQAERDWVLAQPWYQQALAAHAVVYCNAQQLFGAESTEAELHRLLFATA